MLNGAINPTLEITKSLDTLLYEVNNGEYEDFRKYLLQKNITNLDLSYGRMQNHLNLGHLGQALQGTNVKVLNLASCNSGGCRDDRDIPPITDNDIVALAATLKDTQISVLNLRSNTRITSIGVRALTACISDTMLYKLELDSGRNKYNPNCPENAALTLAHDEMLAALEENRKELALKPYYAACVTQCVLLEDVQKHLLTFFPLMNATLADKYQNLAKEAHPNGVVDIQDDEVDYSNTNSY